MDIVEHLEAISSTFKNVQIVMFADLSTQIVLADATKQDTGQEHLDALCVQAAAAFDSPFTALGDILVEQPDEVIVMRDDGVLVALRPTHNSATAICLFCNYGADIDSILSTARKALSETGAA